jgi:glucosamine--fructose-6-phosphate aminotransferase (isomerizing)
MSTSPGVLMAAEIAEQPAVLRGLLGDRATAIRAVSRAVAARKPRFVLLAARGTSDHAALYAKYLLEVRAGLPVGLVSPSTFTVYRARPDLRDVLFVAVSQSGGSPDLIDSVAAARGCGASTLAVTNNPASGLADAAEFTVDVGAGVERAVAATKTYTAELLTLYLVLAGLTGDDVSAATAGLADAAEATLAAHDAVLAAASRYRFASRLVTTARGYCYPTAREAALKLMETCYVSAQAFSAADLLHGPLALLDATVPVIAVTTPGLGAQAMKPVLAGIAERGADLLLVGAPDGLAVQTDGVGEELHPILSILPLQSLALQMAVGRGGDPDAPRGLKKVTETW